MIQAYDRLLEALADPTLTPFVGAGLSAAATGGEQCATWHGLLLDGVETCVREVADLPDGWAATKTKDLDSGDMVSYLSVAEDISLRLRNFHEGREFDSWIRNTVGKLELTDVGRQLIESVCALGTVVVTTNYDSLIEQVTGWKSYTWDDEEFAPANITSEAVLHLHGAASKPRSIILSGGDYQRLSDNKLNQKLSDSLFLVRRFIFIGCGDGMADPHIAPLLEMMIKLIPNDKREHFILVTEDERRQADGLSRRVSAVPYGKRYQELPKFLQRLSASDKANGSQGALPGASHTAGKAPTWLVKAEQAQENLQATLESFDRAEDAMRQVERRCTLPLGIDKFDYSYQKDKHEQLAKSLSAPAKMLEDSSAQIVSALVDAAEEVWQLALPTSAAHTARLAPITDMISELVDVSSRLLAKLTPALDDLQGRVGVSAGYQAPCASLLRACASVEKAHTMAISLRDGLIRQQAAQEPGEARARRRGTQAPASAPSRTGAPPAEPPRVGLLPAELTGSAESEVRLVPILGEVAAGQPVRADQQSGEYLPLPARFVRREDAFAARVRGDSMTGDGVFAGDYVILVPDPEPEDGQMVVVLSEDVEGAEEGLVRVKRLRYEGETGILLESSAPGEPPVPLAREALRAAYRVIGVVRWDIKSARRAPPRSQVD